MKKLAVDPVPTPRKASLGSAADGLARLRAPVRPGVTEGFGDRALELRQRDRAGNAAPVGEEMVGVALTRTLAQRLQGVDGRFAGALRGRRGALQHPVARALSLSEEHQIERDLVTESADRIGVQVNADRGVLQAARATALELLQ